MELSSETTRHLSNKTMIQMAADRQGFLAFW